MAISGLGNMASNWRWTLSECAPALTWLVSLIESSRALAVASAKNHFGLMALKDVDQIKDEIDNWDPRNPLTMLPIKEACIYVLHKRMC